MKGYIFGPISNTGIIRRTKLRFIDENTSDSSGLEEANIQPALTVDGKPTSNNALSIPVEDIETNDPYGIATDISEI